MSQAENKDSKKDDKDKNKKEKGKVEDLLAQDELVSHLHCYLTLVIEC